MWTETDSFTRLLLSKLKTRPIHTCALSTATYSPKQHDLNVLHYHGVYIAKHKTVLKILVKRQL